MPAGPSGKVPGVRALNCSHCGTALTIRALEHTLSVVCPQCLSILDAKDPDLRILQQFHDKERVQPLIPLGARGKWRGDVCEMIGFQVRSVEGEGVFYSWHEYLLFNPFKGFRYLTQYDGHWNDVKTIPAAPERIVAGGKEAVRYLGRTYVHFQTAGARTSFVLGEFPWRVRVGETVAVSDYISPPMMLSCETTEAENVWSLGEYVDGARVWDAFALPSKPPTRVGIFENQPSPYTGKVKQMWVCCAVLLLLLLNLALFFSNFAGKQEVFRKQYVFTPGANSSFVTPTFALKGRTSDVELSVHTDLRNNWAYFNFALINENTGQAYDFGREISYYSGEGSPSDSVLIPAVPSGSYYLRVEPEMSAGSKGMRYELLIRRDVPSALLYFLAAVLIIIPPGFVTIRAAGFEKARWQEGGDVIPAADEGESDSNRPEPLRIG
jgi:hypothetical protein